MNCPICESAPQMEQITLQSEFPSFHCYCCGSTLTSPTVGKILSLKAQLREHNKIAMEQDRKEREKYWKQFRKDSSN